MGRYLDIIRQVEEAHKQTGHDTEPVQEQRGQMDACSLVPGNPITWKGADGKVNDAVVDFLHAYPGEVWAFCTLPDGEWCAVNTKYLKREDAI